MNLRAVAAVVALAVLGGGAWLMLGPPAPGDIAVKTEDVSLRSLADIPATRWQALAKQRIFFGHQSVGVDILAGVADIEKELPQIGVSIVEGGPEAQPGRPGLLQVLIGRNTEPESKLRDFVDRLHKAGPGAVDVALLKFCFVDVVAGTDVEKLFASYQTAVTKLQQELPGTILVHCTVPLTSPRSGLRARLKRLLGRGAADDADNRVRQQFNERLRAGYGGKQPLFDLALAESTLPDGSRTESVVDGAKVPCLAACYTADGGHLNEVGRRAVARELLRVLVTIGGR